MARILAISIRTGPVVRANAKDIRVYRHDLAVQLGKLVQPHPDPREGLLDGFHLGQSTSSLAHVKQRIGEDLDLGAALDRGLEGIKKPNAFQSGCDHPRANDSVAPPNSWSYG